MLELLRKQKGDYFCISTKSITGRWKDNFFRRDELGNIKEFVRDNRDKDIYMCPHGFTRRSRTKEFSLDPALLYADLDECDPRGISIKPTIAIESSPGRHVGYWLTDRQCSEDLNRRLAYMVGADVSGWDRTQVLRVPGTRNYKYESTPRVKILWKDGPRYKVADLEKLIPLVETTEETGGDAAEIYKKYEKKLNRWVRREIFQGKPHHGKRSEVLWKLQNALLESGMSRDEAFTVLWVSPWNKFRDRRNGVDQLWRELDKSLDRHFKNFSVPEENIEDSWDPGLIPLDQVERENIDWLIPGLIARNEVTIVEGDPGLGKSYFVQMVAKSICDGEKIKLVSEKYRPKKDKIVYFDTENTASSVTKPRLEDNELVHQENFIQSESPFSVDDAERWSIVIDHLDRVNPALVVFDTINTYIGAADTHKASETQQAIGYFKDIARRFNCGVVLVRHLTKSGSNKAIYRGQGSIAFAGAARIVVSVWKSPVDEDDRIVSCTKINISIPFQSFTYSIESLPDTLKSKNRSRLVWGEHTDMTSEDMVVSDVLEKDNSKKEAIEFLKESLKDGQIEVTKVIKMAEARSISKTTLHRASIKLGVVKTKKGSDKKSYWSLS